MIFLCEAGLGDAACLSSAGLLQYSHEKGQKGGSLSFKFNLVDPEGNKLIDQSFFISVLGRLPSSLPPSSGACGARTKLVFSS